MGQASLPGERLEPGPTQRMLTNECWCHSMVVPALEMRLLIDFWISFSLLGGSEVITKKTGQADRACPVFTLDPIRIEGQYMDHSSTGTGGGGN